MFTNTSNVVSTNLDICPIGSGSYIPPVINADDVLQTATFANAPQLLDDSQQLRILLEGANKLTYKGKNNNNQKRNELLAQFEKHHISYKDFIRYLNDHVYDVSDLPIPDGFILKAMQNLISGNATDIKILFRSGLSPNIQFALYEGGKVVKRSLLIYVLKANSEVGVRVLIEHKVNIYFFPDAGSYTVDNEFGTFSVSDYIEAKMQKGDISSTIHQMICEAQDAAAEKTEFPLVPTYKEYNIFKRFERTGRPHYTKYMVMLDVKRFAQEVKKAKSLMHIHHNGLILLFDQGALRLPGIFTDVLKDHPDFQRLLNYVVRDDGTTALFRTAQNNAYWLTSRFIKYGAVIDHRRKSGHTALMLAIDRKAYKSMQVLLEHGADPRLSSAWFGSTALSIAQRHKDTNAIRILTAKYSGVETEPLVSPSILFGVPVLGTSVYLIYRAIRSVKFHLHQKTIKTQINSLLGAVDSSITPRKTVMLEVPKDLMYCTIRQSSTTEYSMCFHDPVISAPAMSYTDQTQVTLMLERKKFLSLFKQIFIQAADDSEIEEEIAIEAVKKFDDKQIEINLAIYENPLFSMPKLVSSLAKKIWELSMRDYGIKIDEKFKDNFNVSISYAITPQNTLLITYGKDPTIKCYVNNEAINVAKDDFNRMLKASFAAQLTKFAFMPGGDKNADSIELSLPVLNDPAFSLDEILGSMKTQLLVYKEQHYKPVNTVALVSSGLTKKQKAEIKQREQEALLAKQEEERKAKEKQEKLREEKEQEEKMAAKAVEQAAKAAEKRARQQKVDEHKKAKAAEFEANKQAKTKEKEDWERAEREKEEKEKTFQINNTRNNWLSDAFHQATRSGVVCALYAEPEIKSDMANFKAALALKCNLQKLVCGLIQIQKTKGNDVSVLEGLFRFRTAAGHMLHDANKANVFASAREDIITLIKRSNPDADFDALGNLYGFAKNTRLSLNPAFDLTETALYQAAQKYYDGLKSNNFFTDANSTAENATDLQETALFLRWVLEKMVPIMNRLWLGATQAAQQVPKTVFFSPTVTATIPAGSSHQLTDQLIDVSAATTLLSTIGELYPNDRRGEVLANKNISDDLKLFLLRCKVIRNTLCHWGGDFKGHEILSGNTMIVPDFQFDEESKRYRCTIKSGESKNRKFVNGVKEIDFDGYVIDTCCLMSKINNKLWDSNVPFDTTYRLPEARLSVSALPFVPGKQTLCPK